MRKIYIIILLTLVNFLASLTFFQYRDLISEYLVVNTIEMTSAGRINEWVGLYFYDGQPYTSQPGINGLFFSRMLSLGLEISHIVYISIFFVSLSFNYIFVNCAGVIKERFGLLPAALFSTPLFLSTFYWLDSGNLYWLYPLYIAPFYLVLSKYHKYSEAKLSTILFLFFLIKFCTGFEYAPVVIISAIIPILFYEIDKNRIWVIARRISGVGLVGVLAFAAALLVLILNESRIKVAEGSVVGVIQSYFVTGKNEPHFLKYKNSISTSMSHYAILNKKNDVAGDNANGWSEVLKARNQYLGYSSILDYFSFSSKKALFYTIQAVLALVLLGALAFLSVVHAEIIGVVFAATIAASAAGLWVILMPLHFYLHSVYWRGVSDIILIFPFYSTLGLAFGVYLKMKGNAHAKNF